MTTLFSGGSPVQVRSYPPSALTPDLRELQARLKCPPAELADVLPAAWDRLLRGASCRVCWAEFPVHRDENALKLGPLPIPGRALAANLAGCSRAVLMAATLGSGTDLLLRQASLRSPARHFILDALADTLVEALCDRAEADICAGRPHAPRFSPGYGDLPLTLQPPLLDLLDTRRLLGLHLTDALLMTPVKSVTAVIGLRTE